METIRALAARNGVTLTVLSFEQSIEMDMLNKMMCFGRVILIGHFHDKEHREVVFRHELKHVELEMARPCSYEEERFIWRETFKSLAIEKLKVTYSVLRKVVRGLHAYRT